MTLALDEQANALLNRVLKLPLRQRHHFVAEACDTAPELLALVAILFERINALDTPAPAPIALPALVPAAAAVAPEVGALLAGWRLLREIGRDAEAGVFLAERDGAGAGAVRQSGMLKIARASAACAVTLARFERERQLLSRLNHSDIAGLIDAGHANDGRPFFVMQLVEGMPLDRYCAEQQLSLRQRAALFARICDAVHYAHQLPLIHRNLTPANIVIAADGAPKLLGFGIAGEQGGWPPAPLFASPEQLAGQAPTISADIFALGAILYALLSGRSVRAPAGTEPAVAPALPSAAVRAAGNCPSSPGVFPDALLRPGRTLARRLEGEIDHVLMTALAPDPARRHPSADAFARQLQRYAQKLPLEVAPAPTRRRRWLRGGAVAGFAGVLVLGSALALWSAGEARQARLVAERRAESGRVLLRTTLFEVNDALNAGAAGARVMLLNAALVYLGALSNDDDDASPQLRRELASSYQRIGEISGRADFFQEALRLRALDAKVAPGTGAAPAAPAMAAAALERLSRRSDSAALAYARGLPRAGQLGDALQQFGQLQRELEPVIAADPANADVLRVLMPVLAQLVELRRLNGDLAAARQAAQQWLDVSAQRLQAHPDELRWLSQMGTAGRNLGAILVEQGQLADGLVALRQALETREKIAVADEENELVQRDVADVHTSLAGAMVASGRLVAAEQELALARDIYAQHARANPGDAALRAAWIELELMRAKLQFLQLHGRAAAATLDVLHALVRDLGDSASEAHLAARIDLLDAQIQPRGVPSKALAYTAALRALAKLTARSERDALNVSQLRESAQAWQTGGEIGLRAGQTESACALLERAAKRYQQFEASNRLTTMDKLQQDQLRERRKACI